MEFQAAPNGITGLETALGLALQVLPLGRLVEVMSWAPARVAGLKLAGSLGVGCWGGRCDGVRSGRRVGVRGGGVTFEIEEHAV